MCSVFSAPKKYELAKSQDKLKAIKPHKLRYILTISKAPCCGQVSKVDGCKFFIKGIVFLL